jgi:SAM-dependent methyltransferase
MRDRELYERDCRALPFKDRSFSGATCTFVHHHMDDPIAAFREVHRVLRAGSRLVLLNSTAAQMEHYWVREYFPKLMERATAPYVRFEMLGALGAAGFEVAEVEAFDVTDDLKDWFLLCGKNRPELYLDPRVRAGISFFANAEDRGEVEVGVEKLRNDIESGRVADVQRKHAWDGGDYTFTVAVR